MPDTTCAYSKVVNNSGATKTFSFLPPHGKTLADNEEYTVFGDIYALLQGNKRKQAAFEAALLADDLVLMKLPNPVLFDTTDGNAKMVIVDNTALDIADPCYGAYASP